jgi:serine/threonine-protein kinase
MGDEIGHGGMGAVFRAHDSTLGRDVAVKLLLEQHQGRPDVERRFLEEARIGGQLQHPGVVPVYELGRSADARPFFTMKVVEGRTLADLLDERTSPADGLPRFLGIFEQVCQAVGYAHSRGIIHRDLKPNNVMVGAFGEVQVMDWGLAKVLSGRPSRPAGETLPGAPAGPSVTGSTVDERGVTGVVGTPAYMPPEQARGESAAADERSDVFGLGAILCEILTGCPPFAGTGRAEVLRQAAAGDLADAFARLEGCGADAELVALARACLAPRPEGRPRDGGAVAARVAAYQSGVQERLREAELERAAAEAREEEAKATAAAERKARRRTRALALAVLLFVIGGGGATWWVQQRRQATDAGVSGLMSEARLLFDQAGSARWAEAPKLYAQARDTARQADDLARTGGASAAVREQAADLARSLEEGAAAAERDRRLLVALMEVRGPREGPRYQKGEKGVMVELAKPSADEQFAAAFRAWDPTLDVDALATEEEAARLKGRPPAVLTEVIAALDQWVSERRQDETLKRKDPAEWRRRLERVASLAAALDDSGTGRRELSDFLVGGGLERLEWERGMRALAMALRPVPVPFDTAPGEGRDHLRRLAEKVDVTSEPVLGLLTLARALRVAGDDARAEGLLRKGVRARPQEVVLYTALGHLLESQRPPRWDEAVGCYETARALRPELGEALANALRRSGRVDDGLALYDQLVAATPDNPWLHFQRGYALNDQGRHKEAEAAFREAIRLNPDGYREHNNLGNALYSQGRYKEAEAACREALRLQPDSPEAHNNLGNALNRQGRYKEAEAAFREAIRIQPDLPEAHSNLGNALGNQGRSKEAEAAFREAIRIKPDFPLAHCELGHALREQGRFAEALESLRRGHALGSKAPGWRYTSADWVRQCERLVELDRILPAVLSGDAEPASVVERIELANICQRYKRLHVAATRLSGDAFTADPKLADDLRSQHRYNAACSAALAAAGQGEDAKRLPDKVALMLRRQASRWLRADLAVYAKLAERDDPKAKEAVRQRLAHWQQDPDFASVRDKEALGKLPEDERQDWRQLWDEVAALLKKVQDTK